MKKFEYKVDRFNWSSRDERDVETALNIAGAEGWELVSVECVNPQISVFYFKREVEA